MLRVCASPVTVPAPFSCFGNSNSSASASPASALLLRASTCHAPFCCPPAARLSSSCHTLPARSCKVSPMPSVLLFYPPSLNRRELTPSSSNCHGEGQRPSSHSRADLAYSPHHRGLRRHCRMKVCVAHPVHCGQIGLGCASCSPSFAVCFVVLQPSIRSSPAVLQPSIHSSAAVRPSRTSRSHPAPVTRTPSSVRLVLRGLPPLP